MKKGTNIKCVIVNEVRILFSLENVQQKQILLTAQIKSYVCIDQHAYEHTPAQISHKNKAHKC